MKHKINPLRSEDIEAFLAQYWQKKPLLIRNAFSDIVSPLTPDELAGLACEPESNSRLVLEHIDNDQTQAPWSVEYGPFDEERFASLPESNWSLLVSDVEKYLDTAAEIIDKFRFIPDWRTDDLMISYAPVGGSVGPHTDAYDVFLLQLEGQREWHINEDFDATPLENTELSILKNFTTDQQWILNPGDMLYLPPNVAHHGIALNDCMTASIGFRAPAVNTMIHSYADRLSNMLDDSELYSDPDLKAQSHSAEIAADAIDKVTQLLRQRLTIDADSVARWFGEHSSEPKAQTADPPLQQYSEYSELENAIGHHRLLAALESRFLFSRTESGALLFVDGESYDVNVAFAESICQRRIDRKQLLKNIDSSSQKILLDLYNQGALIIDD